MLLFSNGALWGHPLPLQTYIHTEVSIEHDYLPHANAFGNNYSLVSPDPCI